MAGARRTRRFGKWSLIAAGLVVLSPLVTGAQTQGPPTVDVSVPLQRDITDYDVFTGRIVAVQDIELRARVSGFVESIAFKDGDLVEAGQVLFVLDKRRALAEVSRNEAALTQAEATLNLARTEFERASTLAQRNAIAREELDQKAAAAEVAEAGIAAANASLDLARIELADTEVRAPFAGRISDARLDVGDLVERTTVLTTIVSTDPVEIVFDGTENDYLRYVRLDLAGRALSSRTTASEVRVRLADEVKWTHPGLINFIDNRLDAAAGSIRVRARLPNPEGLLSPGLFAQVRVPRFGPYAALLLPDEAILADQAGRIVYVVDAEGNVQPRAVQIGQMEQGLRVVREGLTAEDRVVVSGLMRIRPGAPVTPQEVDLSGRLQPEPVE